MLYFSEILKKTFPTEEECLKAEEQYKNREVDKNLKIEEIREAEKHLKTLLTEFYETYGFCYFKVPFTFSFNKTT